MIKAERIIYRTDRTKLEGDFVEIIKGKFVRIRVDEGVFYEIPEKQIKERYELHVGFDGSFRRN